MKQLMLMIFAGISIHTYAQGPVRWDYHVKNLGDRKYELTLSAYVLAPYHIYSQHTPAGGPKPTIIQFKPNPLITFSGIPLEKGDQQKSHDQTFDVDVYYFNDHVDFLETVQLKSDVRTNITSTITYMACTDEQCIFPPPAVLSIAVGGQ
jgi:Disulphide bond corrector protein DsbC